MPSLVVLNYGFATELPIGSGAGPLTDLGDLTRVYEAIPFEYGYEVCYGDIFGEVSVRQENHGFDRAELNGALVEVDDLSDETDSTGGYQIMGVTDGEWEVMASKAGFFDGEETAMVECGQDTQVDFELVCANPLFVTVEDTNGNDIPGATVTADATYEYNSDTDEVYTTSGETDNEGKVTFDVAGAADLDITATAAGHDDWSAVGVEVNGKDFMTEENGDCYATPDFGLQMCKWNTVVGTVWIGGQPAEGYVLDLVDMNVNPPVVVDTDTTTFDGVFSLDDLSSDNATGEVYRINMTNPSGTFISTTGDFNVTTCGATSVFTYSNGVWTDDGLW
jgi:hypothetical protein